MSLPSINFLHRTVSEIQPGQTFSRRPPAHPDTISENNTPTALKGCGVKNKTKKKKKKKTNKKKKKNNQEYISLNCFISLMKHTEQDTIFFFNKLKLPQIFINWGFTSRPTARAILGQISPSSLMGVEPTQR